MKSGIKAICLALTFIGASACLPAQAASTSTKSESTQQAVTATDSNAAKAPVHKAKETAAADASDGVVSINSGNAEDLARVMNGVGLKKAQSIVSYREEYGPFKTLEQLQEVPGIGSALVERNLSRIKL